MEINKEVAPREEEEKVRMTEGEEDPMEVEEVVHRAEWEEACRAQWEAHWAKEEEARRAKEEAEKRFVEKDYNGACTYALKAQMLCPSLEGIKEMKATFDVYAASETKFKGETDFYAIFGLKPSAVMAKLIRQFTEMYGLLNPYCNKTVGADGAFNLLSEAWNILSDLSERTSYDIRRNTRGDSFWTKCTTCNVQYEYLLKYVNKKLSCKNCRGVFMAINKGIGPPDGSYPFLDCQHFSAPENCYANQRGTITNIPTTNGVDVSKYKRKSYSGSSVEAVDTNITIPLEAHPIGNGNKSTRSLHEPSKLGKPSSRKSLDDTGVETPSNNLSDMGPSMSNFDSEKLLINRAVSELRKKLPEIRKADAEVAALKKNLANLPQKEAAAGKSVGEVVVSNKPSTAAISGTVGLQSMVRRRASMRMKVPISDFHNFDNDRSEQCFKAKQIWAIYDEEDTMPRLYCLIDQVISVSPFKVAISYMNSKIDAEFGSVNWIESGFTKSCGNFRTSNIDVVEEVNIFSHVLRREKTTRGGCLRIYPRSGDIWAIYKNWSSEWNRETPSEVRHQYEMVEIMMDYDEEDGVCMSPLVKVDGYRTVYGRNPDKGSICWVLKKEMLRFSHRVPCWRIRGGERTDDLPECCWDLDPAATHDGLILQQQEEEEVEAEAEKLKVIS
ncbi:uncharacterized protein LOC124929430 [Impatiens glandulifera]|uniref:uncharacterized protein LOC124929430 n=1 Tax=Impatiens glandulifera TaxID=253017 RepID=UPI001FB0E63D|nr:uncharacterized protein LOC124929430 [Impatiens glandulifera]